MGGGRLVSRARKQFETLLPARPHANGFHLCCLQASALCRAGWGGAKCLFPFFRRAHGGPKAGRPLAQSRPLVSGVLGLCVHSHVYTHRCIHCLSGVCRKPGCVRSAGEVRVRKGRSGVGNRDREWQGWGHGLNSVLRVGTSDLRGCEPGSRGPNSAAGGDRCPSSFVTSVERIMPPPAVLGTGLGPGLGAELGRLRGTR